MKDIKRDNSGFSLVELLIAMVIIAIVLTPLYSNFRESTYLNGRAKATMNETNMAGNIMEGLSAYTPEEIILGFCSYDSVSANNPNRMNTLNILPNEVTVESYGELRPDIDGNGDFDDGMGLITTNFGTAPGECDYAGSLYVEPISGGTRVSAPLARFLKLKERPATDPNHDKYYFFASGVQQARGKYDLVIELDASSASGYSGDTNNDGVISSADHEIEGLNDYEEAFVTNLNPLFDGIYTESANQRQNVAAQFLTRKINNSLIMTEADFYPYLKREMSIKIERDAVTGYVKVSLLEHYRIMRNSFVAASSGQTVNVSSDFSGSLVTTYNTVVFDGNNYKQEPREMYFYYFGNYKSTATNVLDQFEIYNPDEVPVNIHLVRIKSSETSDITESSYCSNLIIEENPITEQQPGYQLRVYSNLRDDLTKDAEHNQENRTNFGTQRCNISINGRNISDSSDAEYGEIVRENGGVRTESGNRLYSVKMYVYEEGAAAHGFPKSMRITEFNGNSMQ